MHIVRFSGWTMTFWAIEVVTNKFELRVLLCVQHYLFLNHVPFWRLRNFVSDYGGCHRLLSTGAAVKSSCRRILIERSWLPISVHRNVLSIKHHFRQNSVFCEPERRLRESSAGGRCSQFSMTDSERVTTSSYYLSTEISSPSCTFAEIMMFSRLSGMTSWYYSFGGAVRSF